MKIDVRSRGFRVSAGIAAHLERRLGFALDRFGDRIARVSVRLGDENGPRGGEDKSCRLAIELRGAGVLRVQVTDRDLYAAIDRAAHRAQRAIARHVERDQRTLVELLGIADLVRAERQAEGVE
jgi:ribosomal subunit interface protein